jgi:cyclopropane-fatty-acyl-phospholipid synthase
VPRRADNGKTADGRSLSLTDEQAGPVRHVSAGLADRVEIRFQDYRDLADGPYDAIASIGMAEHVGLSPLGAYAAHLHALLAPGGRLLNHAIARRPGPPKQPQDGRDVVHRPLRVPRRRAAPPGDDRRRAGSAGFEVRDAESLREHYADTLRAWVASVEQNPDEAVEHFSAGRARVWRLYMAGSALAFQSNRLGVTHVLAVKPGPGGASGFARTRTTLLGVAPAGHHGSS